MSEWEGVLSLPNFDTLKGTLGDDSGGDGDCDRKGGERESVCVCV